MKNRTLVSAMCLFLAFLAVFVEAATAQNSKLATVNSNFISSTRSGTMSVAQVNQLIREKFGNSVSPTAQALDLYKVNYRSQDERNRPVVLSGLVVLPRGGAPNGLVIFNHGTIFNSALAPSRFTGESNDSDAQMATLAFASGGYAVAMPDYLGLGDNTGAHPYPLGAINSRSAVDIIEPARALAKRQNTEVGSRLFVSGYSEGGAVAMWTVRDLEQKSGAIYDVSAAAPASGPYDLLDTTRKWLLAAPTTQEEFVIRLSLTSYMAYYFHKSAGIKLTEYFKPAMAFTISQSFKGNISDKSVIERLALTGILLLYGRIERFGCADGDFSICFRRLRRGDAGLSRTRRQHGSASVSARRDQQPFRRRHHRAGASFGEASKHRGRFAPVCLRLFRRRRGGDVDGA